MSIPTKKSLSDLFKICSQLAGILVAVIGAFVLVGWAWDIPAFKSVLPNFVTMKANTALAFLLGGIATVCLTRKSTNSFLRLLGFISGFLVFIIGILSLSEYLFRLNLDIDQLLFKEPPGAFGTLSPGRMAPTTAFNFFILGIALIISQKPKSSGLVVAQGLAFLSFFMGLVNLIGYFYGVREFCGIATYTQMALHTAAGFLLLSLGVLFSRPDQGLMASLTDENIGGTIARRMLPFAIVIPLVLGWLQLMGDRLGLYEVSFGEAIMVVIMATIFSALILNSVFIMNKIDVIRKKHEEEVKKADIEWKKTFDSIADLIFIQDKDFVITRANKAFAEALKMRPEEIIGKKCYELLHKSNAPWEHCPFEKTRQDHKIHIEEIDDPNIGMPLWVTTSPIFDSENQFCGSIHIAHDITSRKMAEEAIKDSEEKYKTLYDSSADAIMMLMPGKKFLGGNHAAIKLFGCRDENEFIAQAPASLSPQYQPDGLLSVAKSQEMMRMAMERGSYFFEWVHKRIDGSEFFATVLLTRIVIKGEALLQATVRDVTEQRNLMMELQEKVISLEKFQRITIDRELKMKELKTKIAELEAK